MKYILTEYAQCFKTALIAALLLLLVMQGLSAEREIDGKTVRAEGIYGILGTGGWTGTTVEQEISEVYTNVMETKAPELAFSAEALPGGCLYAGQEINLYSCFKAATAAGGTADADIVIRRVTGPSGEILYGEETADTSEEMTDTSEDTSASETGSGSGISPEAFAFPDGGVYTVYLSAVDRESGIGTGVCRIRIPVMPALIEEKPS